MKRIALLLAALFLCIAAPAFAGDAYNPSELTASEIAAQLPRMWLANVYEVQHMMKDYPDFKCKTYKDGEYDQIVCESVNNRFAKEININFWFWGDNAGMTGLAQAVFMSTVSSEAEIQDHLEKFYLEGMFPWHDEHFEFFPELASFSFKKGNTIMRFDLPRFNVEGLNYIIIDYWDENQKEYHTFG